MIKFFLLVFGLLSVLFYKAEIHKEKGSFKITFDQDSISRVEKVKAKAKNVVDNGKILE